MEKIKISDVIVHTRKRDLKNIDSLVESIKELGLINPITINKLNVLVAGYHRLEACKFLGWTEIPYVRINFENKQAELAQIDENIVRNQLTVLENAVQLLRRKWLYENLHPFRSAENIRNSKLLQGSRPETVSQRENGKSFTRDTSEKTGKNERTIQLYIQIATNLSDEIVTMLKGTPMEDNFRELEALAAVKDPEKQKELVEKVLSGRAKNIRAAIKLEQRNLPPEPVDTTKGTVPAKAYIKLLNDYREIELKCFRLESELEALKKS